MSEKESKLLKYTKRVSVLLGFFTIVLALIITVWILPSLHDFHLTELEQDLGGFHSPVLAFQFAKTFYDLKPFSNNPNILEKMDNAHSSWDMIFPFVYNGFIFTNSITYLLQKGRGNSPHLQLFKNDMKNILILLLITTLCITTISFDILENLTLLELSKLMKNNRVGEVLDANLMELRYRTWMKWLSLGCSFFVTMQLEHHQSQGKQSKPKKSTITEQLSMITCLLILLAFLVSENSWGSRLISEENAAKILETMSFFVASTLFFYFIGNALARTEKGYHMPVTLTDYYYSLKDPKNKLTVSRTQIHRFVKSDLEQVTETPLRRRKHMLEKRRSSRSSIYNYRRGVSMMLRYI